MLWFSALVILCCVRKNPLRVAAGRLGGLSRSRAKQRAVRRNGRLGGRPRKDKGVKDKATRLQAGSQPSMIRSVAILYARSDSIYKTLEGCDVWDATRDARNFTGGMPVVAHPPCRAWSAMAHLAKPRPDEKDLARHAVKVVRECGGVLEHPISSKLWADQKLPQPGERDAWGGYTLIMPQWWFGHRAEKGTRFYIVGVAMKDLPEVKLKLGDAPCVVTTSKKKFQTPPDEWRERLGSKEREETPPDMARWLVALARTSRLP